MHNAQQKTDTDHAPRLLDLLGEASGASLGAGLLRVAQRMAAVHRAELATTSAEPWGGLTTLQHHHSKDNAGQGRPADARSARPGGPVTTEGDR